jgi:hypothetical protein
MTLCSLIALSFLLVSCSTSRYAEETVEDVSIVVEQPEDAVSPRVLEAIENRMYLGGVHMENRIECDSCHTEESEDNEVSTTVCISCHTGFASTSPVEAGFVDPHIAHKVSSECRDCHHAHRSSKNQCLSYHSFNLQIP